METDLLVSCDWLNKKIQSDDLGNIVILDVSWSSTKDCHEEYKQCHIAGARYLDPLSADHTELYPRNIPGPSSFTAQAQQAGISTDSHVIVYSNSDRAGYFLAGRAWWTFKHYGHEKVSILDGGLQKWLQSGLPTSSDIPQPDPGNFVCGEMKGMHKSYDDMCANTKDQKFQVVDTRSPDLFAKGHIPGAKNLLMGDLVDPDTVTLKPQDVIKQMFAAIDVDPTQPIVSYCNSGMSSCTLAFVTQLLGGSNASVFHGGYTEWSKRSEK